MIIGPLSIDPTNVQYAQYSWPRLRIALICGDAIIALHIRCSGMEAGKYLRRLDPFIRKKVTADAQSTETLDDSEEEGEARDDLGIEVTAHKIGFAHD